MRLGFLVCEMDVQQHFLEIMSGGRYLGMPGKPEVQEALLQVVALLCCLLATMNKHKLAACG